MSIDIKTLHIGSHVQHHGKRKIVHSIGGDTVYLLPSIVSSVAHIVKTDEIEPIVITPTLLKVLGVEWHESSSCWRKEVGDDVWLFVNGKEEQGFRFNLFPPYEKGVQESILYARYLHEIEGQLAYYGVELK